MQKESKQKTEGKSREFAISFSKTEMFHDSPPLTGFHFIHKFVGNYIFLENKVINCAFSSTLSVNST